MRRALRRIFVIGVALVCLGAVAESPGYAAAAHAPRPSVTSVSSHSGTTKGGATVTVYGTHFTAVRSVFFGSTAARSIHTVKSTMLTVRVPAHLVGGVDVRVRTAAGTSSPRVADQYDYQLYSAVATGYYTSCAAHSGSVRCWGYNGYGQLGDGTTTDSHIPVQVHRLSHVVAVSGGGEYDMCALLSDGTVRCWGDNSNGQLGNGTTTDSRTPVQVHNLSHAVALGAGYYQNCAIIADGTVRCWGGNSDGELGNGTTTNSSTPVRVAGLTHAVSITANYYFSCASRSDGTARCWGDNSSGQLGNGTNTNSSIPVAVHKLSHVTSISAGFYHACALTSGLVKCWGDNGSGQLGNGTTTTSLLPTTTSGLSEISQLSAGGNFTCALARGAPFCWGEREYDEVGDGAPEGATLQLTPAAVASTRRVTQLSSGPYHTCTVDALNRLQCWGYNFYGELGNHTTTDSNHPVSVV